ncbi:MAG: nucleotidyltransferase [Proteobacteria bacterium]|nr:MAG: nucleotidyltransferase [Pseudomonadota bacterium]
MRNLSELLKKLMASDLEFVLVGGFASVIHGTTSVTQDLDICLFVNDEQVAKLRMILKDLDPRHRMNPSDPTSFLDHPKDVSGLKNIYLKTDLGILDIMSEQPPVGDFQAVKSRAVEVALYDSKCLVISLDDLIAIKEKMNRPKDLQTLGELKKIRALKS